MVMTMYHVFVAYLVGFVAALVIFTWLAFRWDGSHGNTWSYWLAVQLDLKPRYIFVYTLLWLSLLWLPLLCWGIFMEVRIFFSRRFVYKRESWKEFTPKKLPRANINDNLDDYKDPHD
jgi:hypothetical protein